MHLQQFQELKFQKIYADFSPDPLGFTQPSWSPQKTLPSYGTEITPRKWRFIGHILWKDSTSVSRTGLFERPKASAKELDRDAPGLHRRTSEKELEDLGLSPREGGYLGQVLLGMCRWLLSTPTPL